MQTMVPLNWQILCCCCVVTILLLLVRVEARRSEEVWKDCNTCQTSDCFLFRDSLKQTPTSPQRGCKKDEESGKYSMVIVLEEDFDVGELQLPGSVIDGRKLNCLCENEHVTYQPQSHSKRNTTSTVASTLTTSESGNIYGNITWSGNITVTGTVTVLSFSTLTILPGTTVTFMNALSGIVVNGKIIAIGTPELPILFTKSTGTYFHSSVTVDSKLDGSAFQYCTFEYGVNGVSVKTKGFQIKFCTFQWNQYGILLFSATITITDSQIINNTRDGIKANYLNIVQIERCVVSYNGATGIVFSYVYFYDYTPNSITNCSITHNGVFGLYFIVSAGNIRYSEIAHNAQGGMYVSTVYPISMSYCNIFENGGSPFSVPASLQGPERFLFVQNFTHNYWATTDTVELNDLFSMDYYKDRLLPLVYFSPVYTEMYPCSDCLLEVEKFMPSQNYLVEDTTWGPNKVYNITNDLVIAPGVKLTVLPGTTVWFATIYVDGYLNVSGSADNIVTFTSHSRGSIVDADGSKLLWKYGTLNNIERFGLAATLFAATNIVTATLTFDPPFFSLDHSICELSMLISNNYPCFADGGYCPVPALNTILISNSVINSFHISNRFLYDNINVTIVNSAVFVASSTIFAMLLMPCKASINFYNSSLSYQVLDDDDYASPAISLELVFDNINCNIIPAAYWDLLAISLPNSNGFDYNIVAGMRISDGAVSIFSPNNETYSLAISSRNQVWEFPSENPVSEYRYEPYLLALMSVSQAEIPATTSTTSTTSTTTTTTTTTGTTTATTTTTAAATTTTTDSTTTATASTTESITASPTSSSSLLSSAVGTATSSQSPSSTGSTRTTKTTVLSLAPTTRISLISIVVALTSLIVF